MVLSDGIVANVKPDGVFSPTLVVDELHPTVFSIKNSRSA